MSANQPAADNKKVTTVVVDNPDDFKGTLKRIGGSRSDHWNNVLINQAARTLWIKHSDEETQDQQRSATVAALIGIGPKDELDGTIAAQLLAAHNAAMECYRRAMLGEQTFEHVTVQAGGQAIAGHVETPGGGVQSKSKGQPYGSKTTAKASQLASLAVARPPLQSEDAERDALSVSGDAERPLPDTRRNVAGRSER
jgi:hypothetical protein